MRTTINIKKSTRQKLRKMEEHRRETYDEIILRLVRNHIKTCNEG